MKPLFLQTFFPAYTSVWGAACQFDNWFVMNTLLAIPYFIVLYFYHLFVSFASFFIPGRFRRRKDITGQTVLITGAGSGVGRQLAIQFSKHSTRLVLLDTDTTSLLETKTLLDSESSVFVYECDVSKPEVVYEVAERIKKEAGDVDILVNNAGIVSGNWLLDLTDEMIVKTMEVNVLAHFWLCRSFLPAMMDKDKGHIVTVASIAGKTGGLKLTDYCASKFAAVGFAEALEIELREKKLNGITVTIVCPNYIDTGLFEGAKIASLHTVTPKYVAEHIVKGVLEDRDTLILPPYFGYIFMLKEAVPRWFYVRFARQAYDFHFMDLARWILQKGATSTKPLKIQ